MVKFQIKKIKEEAEQNFEKTWLETVKQLNLTGKNIEWHKSKGKSHPVMKLIQKIREIFLSYGFEEISNPSIIDETEVYRQYGSEAPVILDRCFYLAELPRPDIGLSKETIAKIKEIAPTLTENEFTQLRGLFRAYKEGKIEGDNFVEVMVDTLDIKSEQATAILRIFPELLKLKPIPKKLILRSHMTALWFPVLAALQKKREMPLKLFSIGSKFRREQQLDALHLYESFVASMVLMGEEITLEDGANITRIILSELGFKEANFVTKKVTSKYYAPQTEMEVFIKFKGEWIEVGDLGLYSPVSLANYDIIYPVFNIGFGVERLAMLIEDETDIRKLSYPQFYSVTEFTDQQLAEMVGIGEKPETAGAQKLADSLIQTSLKNAEQRGPCEFLAYEGEISGVKVSAYVFESDKDAKLLGPAALNMIYAYDGNILGIPEKGMDNTSIVKETREKGVATGIRYLDALTRLFASMVEKKIKEEIFGEVILRTKTVKLPSDVNVRISPSAEQYITSKNKKIMVKGPTFIGFRALISNTKS